MFCYQCQETLKNTGCTNSGVCGKSSETALLQDSLIYLLKGISYWNINARKLGVNDVQVSHFVDKMLFATITNANFDSNKFVENITIGLELKEKIKTKFLAEFKEKNDSQFVEDVPKAANLEIIPNMDNLVKLGHENTPLANKDEDLRSLIELNVYALKGMAAYAEHALVLGYESDEIWAYMEETLVKTLNKTLSVNDWVGITLSTGEYGVKAMALLDEANTTTFGHPEPTDVSLGVKSGPGILVSGHDLLDLKELLEQTEGKCINIYTHGEMLPANAYPELKKFKHLVGNYGQSWYEQRKDFTTFNGPILMTTNCIVAPKKDYKEKIFTTGITGFTGVTHIPDREPGKQKDFSEIIELSLKSESPKEIETGTIPIGFARNTVLGAADAIVGAVKAGAIKRFVVMAGCEGRHKERNYYGDVADELPKDTIILTAGCAKYKFNKKDLGKIGDFPRILDAGQCNDCYSLVVIALKLVEAFGLDSINDLPLSFDISWYEQKAVLVLTALLHLGVKNIRLGPTLPAFVSPNVVNVLVENFNLMGIDNPEKDVEAMMNGK